MTWSLRNTNPKDTNAWDLYEGEVLVARLPWVGKPYGERIVRAMNAHEDMHRALIAFVAAAEGGLLICTSPGPGTGDFLVMLGREAIEKAKP